MKTGLKFACPYCGVEQFEVREVDGDQMTIAYCDPDHGGCDKPFVLRVKIQVIATPLAIENEKLPCAR